MLLLPLGAKCDHPFPCSVLRRAARVGRARSTNLPVPVVFALAARRGRASRRAARACRFRVASTTARCIELRVAVAPCARLAGLDDSVLGAYLVLSWDHHLSSTVPLHDVRVHRHDAVLAAQLGRQHDAESLDGGRAQRFNEELLAKARAWLRACNDILVQFEERNVAL